MASERSLRPRPQIRSSDKVAVNGVTPKAQSIKVSEAAGCSSRMLASKPGSLAKISLSQDRGASPRKKGGKNFPKTKSDSSHSQKGGKKVPKTKAKMAATKGKGLSTTATGARPMARSDDTQESPDSTFLSETPGQVGNKDRDMDTVMDSPEEEEWEDSQSSSFLSANSAIEDGYVSDWDTPLKVGAVTRHIGDNQEPDTGLSTFAGPSQREARRMPVASRARKTTSRRCQYEVTAPEFDGQQTAFDDFLSEFIIVADYNGWDETDRCFHLRNSIVGNAKAKTLALPYDKSWTKMVIRLQNIFCSERAVEAQRAKWLSAKRDPGMDLETYAYVLLDLSRKANPLSVSSEQERFAKEKFIETAGKPHLTFWLRAMQPKTLQNAIDIATKYESAYEAVKPQKPELANTAIGIAAMTGQSREEISRPETETQDLTAIIYKAVEEGVAKHFKNGVIQKQTGGHGKRKVFRCYHCDEVGHLKRNCPELQGSDADMTKRSAGHPRKRSRESSEEDEGNSQSFSD